MHFWRNVSNKWWFPSSLQNFLCLSFAIKTFVFAYQFTMLTHFPTFFCQANFRLTLLFSWLEDLYTSYSSLAYQTSLLGLWDEYPFFCYVACFFSFVGHKLKKNIWPWKKAVSQDSSFSNQQMVPWWRNFGVKYFCKQRFMLHPIGKEKWF